MARIQLFQTGDIIRHDWYCNSFTVVGNYGGRVTICRQVDITQPIEWVVNGKPLAAVTDLNLGDPVRHLLDESGSYIVTFVCEDHATAIMTLNLTDDADGWRIVLKAQLLEFCETPR